MKMNKYQFLVVLAVFLAITIATPVRADEEGLSLSGSIDLAYYSEYTAPFAGLTIYTGPVFRPVLTINLDPTGFYFNSWNSFSHEGGLNDDLGDESHYTIGYNKTLWGMNFDTSYHYYNLYPLDNSTGDLTAVALNVVFPKIGDFWFCLRSELDFPLDRDVREGGLLYKVDLFYTIPWKIPITLDWAIGGHDGAYGMRPEFVSFGRFTISTCFPLGESIVVTPEIDFQKVLGYSEENGGAFESRIFVGINFSYKFGK
ncbi:MAG: hypothetical protein WC560_09540 [Syntrophales bacterium]